MCKINIILSSYGFRRPFRRIYNSSHAKFIHIRKYADRWLISSIRIIININIIIMSINV